MRTARESVGRGEGTEGVVREVARRRHAWLYEIQRPLGLTERYQDPNVLQRCPEKVTGPVIRPRYRWD